MLQATNSQILRDRTKRFALLVIRCCHAIPRNEESRIICRQLLRSATSVAAAHALQLISFHELLVESGIVGKEKLNPLLKESDELVSIFVASLRTAKGVVDRSAR